jgi:PAS domain S-box-containing protein
LERVSTHVAPPEVGFSPRQQDRARSLLSLVTALSRALTPDEVADAMFAEALRAVGADAGMVAVVTTLPDGTPGFHIIRSSGYDDGETRDRDIARQHGRPLSETVRSSRPIFLGSVAEWEARYPGQYERHVAPVGLEALAAIPVSIAGRAIGGMVLGFRGPRTFDEDSRTYLETVGQLCGQALDRARFFEAERRERERNQTLVGAIADAFIALDRDFRFTFANERASALLRLPVESLIGQVLWDLFPTAATSRFGRVFRDAMETRIPVTTEDYSEGLQCWLEVRVYPASDGGLVFFFQDVSQRRHAREAFDFIDEASQVLASSLDYETTLQNLASAAVPRIADWCSVDMLQSPNDRTWPPTLRRVALTHANPRRIALVERLRERVLTDWNADTGLPRVLRDGVSEFTPEITDEMMAASATSDEHLEILREIDLRSLIIVPLTARGKLLGALTLGMAESKRRYDFSDLRLAEDLARRAGTAIDNALLYVDALEARRIAEQAADRTRRLQRLTAMLARALTEQEVLDIIVEQGIVAVGAQAGIVMLVDAAGTHMTAARSVGYPESTLRNIRRIPLDSPFPVRDALNGESVFLATAEEWMARYAPPAWNLSASHAAAVLPLSGSQAPFGTLAIRFSSSHHFDADEREFLVALARQCGQALERARLLAGERNARMEAEDANRAKMEFLATMSHELRTPLNAIGGYAELLEMGIRGQVNEAQKSDLQRIQHSQQQLLSLINDVLNFAKLEAGKVEVNPKAIDVRETVKAIEPLLAPQLAAKRLAFDSRPPVAPMIALADDDKLRQVLLNLLSNAVKFTPEGGEIALLAEQDTSQVRIVVRDTGIGIADQYLDRIFDPFVQLERRLTNVVSGTGLGLAISRDLARAMGGDITVSSEPGRGSTFTVSLRAARER